jgi:hypothetical protein
VRNNLTHDAEKLSFAGSVQFLKKYWTELCSIRHQQEFNTKGKNVVADSLVLATKTKCKAAVPGWTAPVPGVIKVNVDGALDCVSGDAGIGVIASDGDGRVVFTAWKYIHGSSDAEEIEALACKEGIVLAADWCSSKTIIESDCLSLARLFGDREGRRSKLRFILEEAISAGQDLLAWEFAYTRRERNCAAHELAQLAMRTKHSAVWRFKAPACVESIIARECKTLSE